MCTHSDPIIVIGFSKESLNKRLRILGSGETLVDPRRISAFHRSVPTRVYAFGIMMLVLSSIGIFLFLVAYDLFDIFTGLTLLLVLFAIWDGWKLILVEELEIEEGKTNNLDRMLLTLAYEGALIVPWRGEHELPRKTQSALASVRATHRKFHIPMMITGIGLLVLALLFGLDELLGTKGSSLQIGLEGIVIFGILLSTNALVYSLLFRRETRLAIET